MAVRFDRTGLAALIRPRIALLVLVVTAVGYLLERPASYAALPWVVLGTLFVAAAGCALNHFLERDADALMERTRTRPLVTGALTERQVVIGSILSLAAGFLMLGFGAGLSALFYQAAAITIYLAIYTPLKQHTVSNTWIGAIPGALPLLVGAAAAGGPSPVAWAAFGLVFLWQLPHFFAIASMYREQYASGGMRMLSGDDPDDSLLRWQMPLLVMCVMLVSILPVILGSARPLYGLAALGLGALFLLAAFAFYARPDRVRARQVVVASVIYLPLVLFALTLDVACATQPGLEACEDCVTVGDDHIAGSNHDAMASIDNSGLPDHGQLPEFSLVGDDGKVFTRENLGEDVWVVDFIFTRCAVTCGQMSDAYALLMKEGLEARFLSVTVDPRNDGPQELTAYRSKWDGDAESWRLLTGTSRDIQHLAEVGFSLPVNAGIEPVAGMPPLFHSGKFALVGKNAHVRGYYDYRDDLDLKRLREDIAKLAAVTPQGSQ